MFNHSPFRSDQAIYSLCNVGIHCLSTLNCSAVVAAAVECLLITKKEISCEITKNYGLMWGRNVTDTIQRASDLKVTCKFDNTLLMPLAKALQKFDNNANQ